MSHTLCVCVCVCVCACVCVLCTHGGVEVEVRGGCQPRGAGRAGEAARHLQLLPGVVDGGVALVTQQQARAGRRPDSNLKAQPGADPQLALRGRGHGPETHTHTHTHTRRSRGEAEG